MDGEFLPLADQSAGLPLPVRARRRPTRQNTPACGSRSSGHAGFFVETRHGSVLCDPWFTPAYFGSWFPFPRNDGLDPAASRPPDYLYVSHLHRDHFDPEWLGRHVDKRHAGPAPRVRRPFLERELRALGFSRLRAHPRTANAVELDGLAVTILAMTAPADGPLGDSAIVLDDGDAPAS